ncbi:MAG: penicillin-binding protein 2 [Chloroflexota bacterium]
MQERFRIRIVLYGVVILLAFSLLTLRLYQLQILQGEYFARWADQNRFRLVLLESSRGIIYDRQGNILVRNVPRFTVTLIPAYLPDDPAEEERVFRRLAQLLSLPATRAEAQSLLLELGPSAQEPGLSQARSIQEMVEAVQDVAPYQPLVLKRNVSRDTVFQIEEQHLDLPGVLIETEPIREYPFGELIAHLMGYVGPVPAEEVGVYQAQGYDVNQDQVGLIGVEAAFEELLRGHKGEKYIEVDVAGREVQTVTENAPITGKSLRLTIDTALQEVMTQALQRGLDAAQAQIGVTIAMNPQTGEVLGMVSLPAYDNNLFSGGISVADYAALSQDPHHPLINHAISGRHPPGSTFKIIPASAGLQEGIITRQTRINCNGTMWLPDERFPDDPKMGQTFYCWIHKLDRGHGELNIISGIANSCDIYFYWVGGGFLDQFEGLGLEQLSHYAHLFGLGEKTGIDLPGENSGLVPTAKWKRLNYSERWTTGDTYNMSIGQGYVLATPLQMLNATAAIANGGTLYRPQLLYQVQDDEGNVVRGFQPEIIRVLPIEAVHIATVAEGMEAAVTWGSAQGAYLESVRVAGKTGTAEFFDPKIPADKDGNLPTHAWFTAFAPAESPEIALVVFIYNGGEGSETAVPVAAEILRYYFGE